MTILCVEALFTQKNKGERRKVEHEQEQHTPAMHQQRKPTLLKRAERTDACNAWSAYPQVGAEASSENAVDRCGRALYYLLMRSRLTWRSQHFRLQSALHTRARSNRRSNCSHHRQTSREEGLFKVGKVTVCGRRQQPQSHRCRFWAHSANCIIWPTCLRKTPKLHRSCPSRFSAAQTCEVSTRT